MKQRIYPAAVVGFHALSLVVTLVVISFLGYFSAELAFVAMYVVVLFGWEALEVVGDEPPMSNWLRVALLAGFVVVSYLVLDRILSLLGRVAT